MLLYHLHLEGEKLHFYSMMMEISTKKRLWEYEKKVDF